MTIIIKVQLKFFFNFIKIARLFDYCKYNLSLSTKCPMHFQDSFYIIKQWEIGRTWIKRMESKNTMFGTSDMGWKQN